MVITWILNSIVPEIRSSLVFIPLVVDVWNDIHVRYTQSNGPRIFELKRAISALNQDTLSISAYYTKFKMLWDDFVNASNVRKCVCQCNCKAKARIEQHDEVMKVTEFLMGLNELYTNIIGQFLMMNPMPKLTQVLYLLQQEERQRSHVNLAQPAIESTVLMNKTVPNFRNYKNNPSQNDFKRHEFKKPESTTYRKNNLECTYCHGTNHTRDRCYHLIDFPPRKPVVNSGKVVAQMSITGQNAINTETQASDGGSVYQTSEVNINNTLSNAQYQQLIQLLNQNTVSSSSSEIPQSGTSFYTCSYMTSVCLVNNHASTDWILDSGATDHITCSHSSLSKITLCDIYICVPNGHHTKVKMKGIIQLTSDIVLYDVLLVPAFQFNLISVSKLTSTLHCDVLFYQIFALFRTLCRRR